LLPPSLPPLLPLLHRRLPELKLVPAPVLVLVHRHSQPRQASPLLLFCSA
jgi:hypothetical protein